MVWVFQPWPFYLLHALQCFINLISISLSGLTPFYLLLTFDLKVCQGFSEIRRWLWLLLLNLSLLSSAGFYYMLCYNDLPCLKAHWPCLIGVCSADYQWRPPPPSFNNYAAIDSWVCSEVLEMLWRLTIRISTPEQDEHCWKIPELQKSSLPQDYELTPRTSGYLHFFFL